MIVQSIAFTLILLIYQSSCSFAFAPSRFSKENISNNRLPTKSVVETSMFFPMQRRRQQHILLHMTSPSEEEERLKSPQKKKKDVLDLGFDISPFVTYTTSILGITSATVLIWSEVSIVMTRCGTILLSDATERSAYVSIFIIASGTNLSRIIFGSSMTKLLLGDIVGEKVVEKSLFGSMEVLVFISVLGAFTVLAWQVLNGDAFADGAGLSGIDVRWCKLMNEV